MEFKVQIPEEAYSIVKFAQEDFPGVASINTSMINFDSKIVFPWHLSIMVNLINVNQEGLPTKIEGQIVDSFEDLLIDKLDQDKSKPNGIFLARIAWNSTIELIWRVHDPESISRDLQDILEEKSYHRKFDYRIDQDPKWNLAEWHLSHFR